MDDRHVVAVVKSLPHRFLFGDNRTATGSQLLERGIDAQADIFQDRIVHRFHDGIDGEPESLAGNSTPVGASTADA